jgi:hypothetical protein
MYVRIGVHKMKAEKAGEYAFILCVIIAILAGIAATAMGLSLIAGAEAGWLAWVVLILVILGVIVGMTTVTEKEITPFLVAVIALSVTAIGVFTPINMAIPYLGTLIDNIVKLVASFTAPAAIILAVKAIYALASKK